MHRFFLDDICIEDSLHFVWFTKKGMLEVDDITWFLNMFVWVLWNMT